MGTPIRAAMQGGKKMAKLNANIRSATYTIAKFRGINESENDSQVKDGEASSIVNFRVTDDGALTPRPSLAEHFNVLASNPAFEGKVTQLYSGFSAGEETLWAIACGHLFKLTETALQIISSPSGELPETSTVFSFGGKVYVLTGNEYYRVDGTSLAAVCGYVPTIIVGASADGSGTLVERVNLLNTQRRIRYSADGKSTDYYIPEQGNVSVICVMVDGVGKVLGTDYTIQQGNAYGVRAHVKFSTPPTSGNDNIEITYSIDEDQEFRSNIYQTASGVFDIAAQGTTITGIVSVSGLTESGSSWQQLSASSDYTLNGTTMTLTNPARWSVVYVRFRIGSLRNQVTAMKYAELYNGTQDNRVFLYGNGSNKCVYSGIDEDGQPNAEYFPDLNECQFGDPSAPLTAMVKHRNRLLAFKKGEAYSVYSNLLSLSDGSTTTGFYISAINKQVGCCAANQAETVENRIRTLDGTDVWEWKSTNTSGTITGDARNTERISQRVYNSLQSFDFESSKLFYDKYRHEFYCFDGSKALVQNVESDAWYLYVDFPVTCMCRHNGQMYGGTDDGRIVVFDETAEPDFDSRWLSGNLDFGNAYTLKYSPKVWVRLVPEKAKQFRIAVEADAGASADENVSTPSRGIIKPVYLAKLKLRKFTASRLEISTSNRMTITGASISVAYTNAVK